MTSTSHIASRAATARTLGLAVKRKRAKAYRPPSLIESDYAAKLVDVVDKMRDATGRLTSALPHLLRRDDNRSDIDQGRHARDVMNRIRHDVEQAAPDSHVERIAHEYGRRVAVHQGAQLQDQARAKLGIDVHLQDAAIPSVLQNFVHENVSLVRRLKGDSLNALETIITRSITNNAGVEAVTREIADRFDIAERHARLIARDQISRVDSAITEARHRELGLNRFFWVSMRDAIVRREHRSLDNGQPYSYDAPPAEGLPGRARKPGCRCVAVPVWDDLQNAVEVAGGGVGLERIRGDVRLDQLRGNPNHDTRGRFAARGAAVHGAKFDDRGHQSTILHHKLTEAHHRNESIKLGFHMKALRDEAATAHPGRKAEIKTKHAALAQEREHHRWAAAKARAERIQANKDLATAKAAHRERQRAGASALESRGAIGFGRVHGENDHAVVEGHASPGFTFTPIGGRIHGEGDHATVAVPKVEHKPVQPKEDLVAKFRRKRMELFHSGPQEHSAGPVQGPAMNPTQEGHHRERQRKAQEQAFLARQEAKRPVQTPHGYTVEEHWPGIKTYVSPQGNRYTEYDVKRGTLDKPAKPEDFPAARVVSLPAPQRRGIVSRIKSAFGR